MHLCWYMRWCVRKWGCNMSLGMGSVQCTHEADVKTDQSSACFLGGRGWGGHNPKQANYFSFKAPWLSCFI